jgi:uncharacterized coiled-coil protein SlyX
MSCVLTTIDAATKEEWALKAMWAAVRIEELEAKLDLSEGALDVASKSWGECQRILEQTEAKLARAVEALKRIELSTDTRKQGAIAMATLAEMKGETDA